MSKSPYLISVINCRYFFDSTYFWRLGQKWFFGRFEDTKMSFRNYVTFSFEPQ